MGKRTVETNIVASVKLSIPDSMTDDELARFLDGSRFSRGHGCSLGGMVHGEFVTVDSIDFGGVGPDDILEV